jgi:hypothetical protein
VAGGRRDEERRMYIALNKLKITYIQDDSIDSDKAILNIFAYIGQKMLYTLIVDQYESGY